MRPELALADSSGRIPPLCRNKFRLGCVAVLLNTAKYFEI